MAKAKSTAATETTSELETIVVRVIPGHPTGSRNRAWFQFGTSPSFVEVTPEQKAIIEADEYLKIIEAWTALEQGLNNPAKTIDGVVLTPDGWATGNETPEGDPKTPPKTIEEMTQEELIAELEAKWLKAWTDFDAEAKTEDLIELVKSL